MFLCEHVNVKENAVNFEHRSCEILKTDHVKPSLLLKVAKFTLKSCCH